MGAKASQKSGVKATKRFSKSKGTLAAIGGLLVVSAVIRAAIGATEAIAKEESAFASTAAMEQRTLPPESSVESETEQTRELTHVPDVIHFASEGDALPLIQALNARESRVSERENALEIRMQALAVAEQEIDRKMAALIKAEQALSATMERASTAAQDDVDKLTEVYSNMKPKQAAALFEAMAPEFAAGFLVRMRSDSAAAIMAGLSPDAAYHISVVMAGRNANAPRK